MKIPIDTVVFDLGGVLIEWNPRHLYRKMFGGNEAEMEYFLAHVCTTEWNERQDEGRTFAEGVQLLCERFPEYVSMIKAYDERWEEMLGDEIAETVAVLSDLFEKNCRLLALSNWSKEKFPFARSRFSFLCKFEGIVISGEEGIRKPDHKIFAILHSRYAIDPGRTLFIDDTIVNVQAARSYGFQGHHFLGGSQLKRFFLSEVEIVR